MTRKTAMLALFVGLICLGLATGSWAQGGWKRWGATGQGYDPKTVETVAGEVVRLHQLSSGRGRAYGVGLTLKTDKETLQVMLGPAWFVEKQGLDLAPRDRVEIKGSRVSFQGRTTLIAGEVRKGDRILKLRNDAGVPAWAGRKWNF